MRACSERWIISPDGGGIPPAPQEAPQALNRFKLVLGLQRSGRTPRLNGLSIRTFVAAFLKPEAADGRLRETVRRYRKVTGI